MGNEATQRRLLCLFADILDYPSSGLVERARECEGLTESMSPEAAALLRSFRSFVEEMPPGRLEELYTGFFDLNPVCFPYVGYHLFGESYKRSVFLLALKERYRACGFQAGEGELPDRLSLVLRFLSLSQDRESNREMVAEGLLPALERMTKGVVGSPGPVVQDDVQLEGHSQGEVLAGGFVLGAMEEAESGGGPGEDTNPYRQALRALQMVLHQLQGDATTPQGAHHVGGKPHG